MNQEEMKEFEELTKPLIEFLIKNHNPHTKVIIDCFTATILTEEAGYVAYHVAGNDEVK